MSKFLKALEEAEWAWALWSASAAKATRSPTPLVVGPAAALPDTPLLVTPMPAGPELEQGSTWPLCLCLPIARTKPNLAVAGQPGRVDPHVVSLVMPATFEAEQYRALRDVVERRRKRTGTPVLAVSSPGVGDGKTLTAANLAGALAQAPDARVLLIDADLRRPGLGRLFGLAEVRGPGLMGAILDPCLGIEQVSLSLPPFNLSIVCAGATPASPYDVLKSARFGELLQEARHLYDYVVLDAPPLVPVQDCRVIARSVDGFLLVVAARRTPRRRVEEALAILDHEKILGFVFNDEEESSISGSDSKYYRSYYAPSFPPHGAWRALVDRIGGSLRGYRARSRAARQRSRGGFP